MIIDCHTHVFPPEFIRDRERLVGECPWFGTLYANPKRRLATAEQLLESMKHSGIDRAVAFGFPWADPGMLRAANDYVLDAAQNSGGRLIPFAVVNPSEVNAAEREIARIEGRGLRGLGELMSDGQGFRLDDDRIVSGLMKLAAAHKLIVMMHASEPVGHAYPGKGTATPDLVCRVAANFPEVRMICAHWGGGLMAYEMMSEVATALKNVYYDSAASSLLYDDRAFRVGAILAPKKILFATDYPLLDQSKMLKRATAALDGSDRLADFLGANAARLFELKS
jgi:predicted TIM-barrel fold metal-dependent hydrolase